MGPYVIATPAYSTMAFIVEGYSYAEQLTASVCSMKFVARSTLSEATATQHITPRLLEAISCARCCQLGQPSILKNCSTWGYM